MVERKRDKGKMKRIYWRRRVNDTPEKEKVQRVKSYDV